MSACERPSTWLLARVGHARAVASIASLALLASSSAAGAAPAGASVAETVAGSATDGLGPAENAPAPNSPEASKEPPPRTDEPPPPSTIGGVAGAPTAASKEEAARAQADLEGQIMEPTGAMPQTMPRLEAAGWWTMFGTLVLGTTAGVFAGLAEKKEDEAVRIATEFEADTGKQPSYEDRAGEYQDLLDKGETYQWVARSFLIAGGAALAAAITLFAVNARRERGKGKARARVGLGTVEVVF